VSEKTFTPYIEITKAKNEEGKTVYSACLWLGDNYWPGPEYVCGKTKATTMLNTKTHFFDRIRSFGKVLGIEVEENY
jgi:hypothetical protein